MVSGTLITLMVFRKKNFSVILPLLAGTDCSTFSRNDSPPSFDDLSNSTLLHQGRAVIATLSPSTTSTSSFFSSFSSFFEPSEPLCERFNFAFLEGGMYLISSLG